MRVVVSREDISALSAHTRTLRHAHMPRTHNCPLACICVYTVMHSHVPFVHTNTSAIQMWGTHTCMPCAHEGAQAHTFCMLTLTHAHKHMCHSHACTYVLTCEREYACPHLSARVHTRVQTCVRAHESQDRAHVLDCAHTDEHAHTNVCIHSCVHSHTANIHSHTLLCTQITCTHMHVPTQSMATCL